MLAVLRWRRWHCPSSRTAAPHGDFQTVRRRPLSSFAWFSFSKFPPGFKLSLFSCFFGFSVAFSSVRLFLSPSLSLRFFFLFFFGFSLFPSVPFSLLCWVLFIEPVSVAFHYGAWGAGHAAAGRGAVVQACLPRFRQRGGWSTNVFSRWPKTWCASGWWSGVMREGDNP